MRKTILLEEELTEDDFYSENIREELLENDELNPSEAGFMKGYEEAI